jgi:putative hemolysin
MDIVLLFVLILINGLFAMSEIALVTAKRARLSQWADQGDRGALAALDLHDTPTRLLSTLQIGITSIGILNGIVGQLAFAEPLARIFHGWGLETIVSEIVATTLVVLVITYVSIVIGELLPKRIGQLNAERIARWVARPMLGLERFTRPFVGLLSWSTDALLRLLRQNKTAGQTVTEEDIHTLLQEGSAAGVIEEEERDMARNLFRLDDRQVGSLMTPRIDMVWLDSDRPLSENLHRIADSPHACFPVCRGDLGEVLGIANTQQLLRQYIQGDPVDLHAQLDPVAFVPESISGMDLLAHFRVTGTTLALAVDEYGEVQGLVTLKDVLEALTGEFRPPSQDEAWVVRRDDGSYLLDGLIPLPELKDRLAWNHVPEEDKNRYHTLSGLMMCLLDRMPRTGDRVTWAGWILEVVDIDGRRVDKVLAQPVPLAAHSPSDKGLPDPEGLT